MSTETLSAPPSRWTGLLPLWRQTPLSFRIGLIILVIHLIVAVTGPFWAPYGFSQMGTGRPLSGMSWVHPFGVDQLGRDIFSRVVHGSHIVILLSLSGNPVLIVLVVALVYAPRIARMARSVAVDIATRDYVTVARLRGA